MARADGSSKKKSKMVIGDPPPPKSLVSLSSPFGPQKPSMPEVEDRLGLGALGYSLPVLLARTIPPTGYH